MEDVVDILWKTRAIKVSLSKPFRLASGKMSPIYIDCRRLISFPQERSRVVELSCDVCRKVDADVVAGCETAGIPFASFIAERLQIPMVYVRRDPKGYGTASQVEGVIRESQKVLICDDVITDGISKRNFIQSVRKAGGIVEDCLVIFDREQGGAEKLSKMKVNLHSLAGMQEALDYGLRRGFMLPEEFEEVKRYLANPAQWRARE